MTTEYRDLAPVDTTVMNVMNSTPSSSDQPATFLSPSMTNRRNRAIDETVSLGLLLDNAVVDMFC